MKKIIALAVSLVIALSVSAEFKEGDILWQMSKSKQSPLIQLAALSPWSHCGAVVEKNKKLKQRGISKNQLVVAPSDLLSYKHYE